jgi:hypothetical protein
MSIFKYARVNAELQTKLRIPRADWKRKDDRAAYMQSYYASIRLAWLDKLVPSRVCQCCGKFKAASRSWVITYLQDGFVGAQGEMALCRSCAHKRGIKAQHSRLTHV